MSVPNGSEDYDALLRKAREVSRRDFGEKGYIFTQIGLNASPCTGNCSFCSLAMCNTDRSEMLERPLEDVVALVSKTDFTRVTAVFLMTTADFDPEKFLEYGRAVRQVIPDEIALVANTADFDRAYAHRMRDAGFTGVYHIVRLREGIDTGIAPETRIQSLDAAEAEGLRIYYCIEPIGPEHTYDELVTEMLRARKYHVDVMAAMRRVNVAGTPYETGAVISDAELTKIVAVTRLVVMPRVSMNVHEPNRNAMAAGVNQLYAELWVNPRDSSRKTEESRGYSVDQVTELLAENGCRPCIEKRIP